MTDTVEPPKFLSVRETKLARTDRKRQRVTTSTKPLTDRQRAACSDPVRLQANRDRFHKWRMEVNGGKVASRAGVPDGWAGKAKQRKRLEIIKVAETKAETVVETLVEQGRLDKDAEGTKVLKWAIGVVLSKDSEGKGCYPIREQLAAAKLVADFTLSKPEAKSSVKVTSEDFLEALLAKEPSAK